MQNTKQINFREWLSYKVDSSDYRKLYFLYTAVEKNAANEYCTCERIGETGETSYLIRCKDIDAPLSLINEQERTDFLSYLLVHYIPEQNIEEWYEQKMHIHNKQENFGVHEKEKPNRWKAEEKIEIKPHSKENKYYNIKLVISILIYSGFVIYMVIKLIESQANIFFALPVISFVVLFFIFRRIVSGLFVGSIKGNALRITEDQFPEIHKVIQEQSKRLGFKEAPSTYIMEGQFNAFVTRLARNHIMLLYSDLVVTSMKGDDKILQFVIGHELGHIKRRHLLKRALLLPSALIPFLSLAYSRGCEYTCDRIGYSFSPTGAVEGILTLSVGKDLYSRVNPEKYLEQVTNERSFWIWFSEKFSTHPHTGKRLAAITQYRRYTN